MAPRYFTVSVPVQLLTVTVYSSLFSLKGLKKTRAFTACGLVCLLIRNVRIRVSAPENISPLNSRKCVVLVNRQGNDPEREEEAQQFSDRRHSQHTFCFIVDALCLVDLPVAVIVDAVITDLYGPGMNSGIIVIAVGTFRTHTGDEPRIPVSIAVNAAIVHKPDAGVACISYIHITRGGNHHAIWPVEFRSRCRPAVAVIAGSAGAGKSCYGAVVCNPTDTIVGRVRYIESALAVERDTPGVSIILPPLQARRRRA